MKTAYQIAVKGPTKRVPSRRAGSRPNSGSIPASVRPEGVSANSSSMIASALTPPR